MSPRAAAPPRRRASNATASRPDTPYPRLPLEAIVHEVVAINDASSSAYSVSDSEAMDTALDGRNITHIKPGCGLTQVSRNPNRNHLLRIATPDGRMLCADGKFRDRQPAPGAAISSKGPLNILRAHSHRRNGLILQLSPAVPVEAYESDIESDGELDEAPPTPQTTSDCHASLTGNSTSTQTPHPLRTHPSRCSKAEQVHPPERQPFHEPNIRELFHTPVQVPASRFVVSNDKLQSRLPTRRPSLVRRLSNSLKHRLSTLAKTGRDVALQSGDPKELWRDGRTELPVEGFQKVHVGVKGCEIAAPPLPIPSISGNAAAGAGHANRHTRWSDFMDKKEATSRPKSKSTTEGIPLREPTVLEKALPPLPLQARRTSLQEPSPSYNTPVHGAHADQEASQHAARKESLRKRVDTSCKSWMPPDRKRSCTRHQNGKTKPTTPTITPDSPRVHDSSDTVEAIIDSHATRPEKIPKYRSEEVKRLRYGRMKQQQQAAHGKESVQVMATIEDFRRMKVGAAGVRGRHV